MKNFFSKLKRTTKKDLLDFFIKLVFVGLYMIVSVISLVHVIEFFQLSNSYNMSVFLAIAFEVGAMASLLALTALDKIKVWVVWSTFIILTIFQAMGNVYASYVELNLDEIKDWIELFNLQDQTSIFKRRIVAIISGLPIPLLALAFIKSLIDYLKPSNEVEYEYLEEETEEEIQPDKTVLTESTTQEDISILADKLRERENLNDISSIDEKTPYELYKDVIGDRESATDIQYKHRAEILDEMQKEMEAEEDDINVEPEMNPDVKTLPEIIEEAEQENKKFEVKDRIVDEDFDNAVVDLAKKADPSKINNIM